MQVDCEITSDSDLSVIVIPDSPQSSTGMLSSTSASSQHPVGGRPAVQKVFARSAGSAPSSDGDVISSTGGGTSPSKLMKPLEVQPRQKQGDTTGNNELTQASLEMNNSSGVYQQNNDGERTKCFSVRRALAFSSFVTFLAIMGCGVGFYFVSESTLMHAGREIGVAEIGTAYETLSSQMNLLTHRIDQISSQLQMAEITPTQEGIMEFFNSTLLNAWVSSVVEEEWALGFGLVCFFPDGAQIQYPQVYFDQGRYGQRTFMFGSVTPKANASNLSEPNVLNYHNLTVRSTGEEGLARMKIDFSEQPLYSNPAVDIPGFEQLLTDQPWNKVQQWSTPDNVYHFLSYWRQIKYTVHNTTLTILPLGWLSVTGTLAEYDWVNKSEATVLLADRTNRIFTTNRHSLNDLLLQQLTTGSTQDAGTRDDAIDARELGSNFPDPVVSGIFTQVESKGYLAEDDTYAGATHDFISTSVEGKTYFVVHTHLFHQGALDLSLIWFQEVDSLVGDLRFNQILVGSLLICALALLFLGVSLFAYQTIVSPLMILRGSMEALKDLDMKTVTWYELEQEETSYTLQEIDSLFSSYRSLRRTVREAVPFLPQLGGGVTATAALVELAHVDAQGGLGVEDRLRNEDVLSSIGGSSMHDSVLYQKVRGNTAGGTSNMGMSMSLSMSTNPFAPASSQANKKVARSPGPPTPASSRGGKVDSFVSSHGSMPPSNQQPMSYPTDSSSPSNASRNQVQGVELVQATRAVIAHFQFGPEVRSCCMDKHTWKEVVYALQFEVTKHALESKGSVFHLSTDAVAVVWSKVAQAETKSCTMAHKVLSIVKERLRWTFPTVDFRTARPMVTVGIASAMGIVGSTGTLLKKGFTVESEAVLSAKLYAQVALRCYAEILVEEDIHAQAWMFGDLRLAEVIRVPPYWGPLGDRPSAELRTLYQSLSATGDDNDEWMYVLQEREKGESSRLDKKAFEAMVRGDLTKARELYLETIQKVPVIDAFLEKRRHDLKIPDDVIDLEDPETFASVADGIEQPNGGSNSTGSERSLLGLSGDGGHHNRNHRQAGVSSGATEESSTAAVERYFQEIAAGQRSYFREASFQDALPMLFEMM